MQHLALYRKYRPVNFENIIGQDHIIKTLKNQVKTGQISHAYLFNGTRGTGKTSTAKVLAKAINCLNPQNGSPCLECEVCKSLEDQSNLDILEIDAASNNRVDEIRDLREKIKYPPVNGKYKVYIVDEVHMLTDSAFNALLKTLEEPPSHAVFILATTEVHKLPATILSRVMRFDFKLVSINDLVELLKNIFKKEEITADEESLKAIAVAGDGSVRDTLSVADVCASFSGKSITYKKVLEALGTTTKDVLINVSNAIIKKDSKSLLTNIDKLFNEGKSLSVLAKDLTKHFRDLLIIKTMKETDNILVIPKKMLEKMQAQAKEVTENALLSFMQTLASMETELKYSTNERLLFETATLSCIHSTNALQALQTRVEQLEKLTQVQPNSKKFEAEAKNTVKKTIKPQPNKKIEDYNKESKQNNNSKINQNSNSSKTTENDNSINLSKVWGEFLISLNAKTYPVLYTAVVDAKPLKYENNTFVLQVNNKIAFNTLSKNENKKVIEKFLKNKQIDAKLKTIMLNSTEKNNNEEILTQKFGKKLKIIN